MYTLGILGSSIPRRCHGGRPRRPASVARLLVVVTLASCGPVGGSGRRDGGAPGWDGHLRADSGGNPAADRWRSASDSGLPPTDPCSDAAKLIYVVDEDMRFSSFDPQQSPPVFRDLGHLSCPAGSLHPFSMSVDRDAVAWVLYTEASLDPFSPTLYEPGRIFKVDTESPTLTCTSTSFQPGQQGLTVFGMGFASDNVGSNDETLYVAGGDGPGTGLGATLASIDSQTLRVATIGTVSGWPELTGTGDAKLWGFYPDTTPPKIAEIDKRSGAETRSFPLRQLQGEPAAWAFAFWGGDFWIFLMRQSDIDTHVYRVRGSDGMMTEVLSQTGRRIVGAGVSTCAPVIVD